MPHPAADNPYQSPAEAPPPTNRSERFPAQRTLEVLRAQRAVERLLLLKIVLEAGLGYGVAIAAPENVFVRLACGVAFLLVTAALGYFIFRGTSAVFGPRTATIYSVLSVVPCLGLLIAVAVDMDLRDVLNQTGVPVGPLGATSAQLEQWQSQAKLELPPDS